MAINCSKIKNWYCGYYLSFVSQKFQISTLSKYILFNDIIDIWASIKPCFNITQWWWNIALVIFEFGFYINKIQLGPFQKLVNVRLKTENQIFIKTHTRFLLITYLLICLIVFGSPTYLPSPNHKSSELYT